MNLMFTFVVSIAFLFNQTAWSSSDQCVALFENSKSTYHINIQQNLKKLIQSDQVSHIPHRLSIEESVDKSANTVIKLTSERQVKDTKLDALELANYLFANPDIIIDAKEIFKKGTVILTFPIQKNYNIDVTYKASGRGNNFKYLIDRISVKSPADITLVEYTKNSIYDINSDDIHLIIKEIVLEKGHLKGLTGNLDLPLYLPGSLAFEKSTFNKIAKYFNLYQDKAELQKLLETKSIRYISTVLSLKYQMTGFLESFKEWGERFGRMAWGPLTAVAATTLAFATTDLAEYTKEKAMEYNIINNTTVVERVFNGIEFPSQNSEVIRLFSELKLQAKKQFKDKKTVYPVPKLTQLQFDQANYFSRVNKMWIVEKYDPEIKANRTYAALVIESARLNGYQTPEAFIMEIDPIKYAPLIQFVRSQGLVTDNTTLQKIQNSKLNQIGVKNEKN